MNPDVLEDLAFHGAELPESLTNAETLLFLELRALYQFARETQMGADQGKREKNRILAAYQRQEAKEREYQRIFAHHADLWKRIENAARRYHEERSLEAADSFVEAVYGVGRKERSNAVQT